MNRRKPRYFLHVNTHVLRANQKKIKHGADLEDLAPPLVVRRGRSGKPIPAFGITWNENDRIVYSPLKPLQCSATCWIEIDGPVTIIDSIEIVGNGPESNGKACRSPTTQADDG